MSREEPNVDSGRRWNTAVSMPPLGNAVNPAAPWLSAHALTDLVLTAKAAVSTVLSANPGRPPWHAIGMKQRRLAENRGLQPVHQVDADATGSYRPGRDASFPFRPPGSAVLISAPMESASSLLSSNVFAGAARAPRAVSVHRTARVPGARWRAIVEAFARIEVTGPRLEDHRLTDHQIDMVVPAPKGAARLRRMNYVDPPLARRWGVSARRSRVAVLPWDLRALSGLVLRPENGRSFRRNEVKEVTFGPLAANVRPSPGHEVRRDATVLSGRKAIGGVRRRRTSRIVPVIRFEGNEIVVFFSMPPRMALSFC